MNIDKLGTIVIPQDDGTNLRVTVARESRDEVEEPKWWFWADGEWDEGDAMIAFASIFAYPDGGRVNVYGTTADRDSKRDALLEAARKAGRPD